VLLYGRHDLPVHTAVVLLRPEADDPGLTGTVAYQSPHGRGGLEFRYQVVRVWQRPVETLLAGGLGTMPLVPLSDVPRQALPGAIHRMEERLSREAPPADAAKLWAATYILMGLRYRPEFAAQLLKGVRAMKESSTYQAILAEGRAEGRAEGQAVEARKILLRQGTKRFGSPDARTQSAIEAISDVERLEQLTERLLDVSSWDELLATP
jgi:predicted transposase YdaD